MASPKGKKTKKEEPPEFTGEFTIGIDHILLRIIASRNLTVRERIELRKVSKQFKKLVDEYYLNLPPDELNKILYEDLLILQKLYKNHKNLYLHKITDDINKTVDEFMGKETGRISVLTRKLRSGEFNVAIADRLLQKINEYYQQNMDTFAPGNQLAVTVHSNREEADIRKKITMLEKFLNKAEFSSKKTSTLGKYYPPHERFDFNFE